jgi:two-component system, OmpR family, sensor histidine kinase ChvG
VGLRAKLFLVSLTLAAIPLVGVGYLREMERLLSAEQEQNLIASARAVATALHNRPALFKLKPEDPLLKRERAEAIAVFTEPASGEAQVTNPAPGGTSSSAAASVIATEDTADPRAAANEVADIVSALDRAQSRVWVIDRKRRLLALAGSLKPSEPEAAIAAREHVSLWERIENATLRPLYARLLKRDGDFDDSLPEDAISGGSEVQQALSGIPATRRRATPDARAVIVSAAHPVWADDQVVATVVVEQTTRKVQAFATQALEKLITGTLAVFALVALVLALFASRLAGRIVNLRNEAEAAIDDQGRLAGRVRKLKESAGASDEIGDLSRSFSQALERLAHYHDYLEQLGARLTHEFRTPMAVVRSSLDNLRMTPIPEDAQTYLARADEGLARLSNLLSRMSEARRVESAMADSARMRYEPRAVLSAALEGYRQAMPDQAFEAQIVTGAEEIEGSPELLVQAIDKLIANAVSFATPATPVVLRVTTAGTHLMIEVENQGPPLPAIDPQRMFDSMVSVRSNSGAETHLGLGLYIVRLVAQFHGGSASARNRSEGGNGSGIASGRDGAVFTLKLPIV